VDGDKAVGGIRNGALIAALEKNMEWVQRRYLDWQQNTNSGRNLRRISEGQLQKYCLSMESLQKFVSVLLAILVIGCDQPKIVKELAG
jgi:hypothetical protein